jgi:hypothetical protein
MIKPHDTTPQCRSLLRWSSTRPAGARPNHPARLQSFAVDAHWPAELAFIILFFVAGPIGAFFSVYAWPSLWEATYKAADAIFPEARWPTDFAHPGRFQWVGRQPRRPHRQPRVHSRRRAKKAEAVRCVVAAARPLTTSMRNTMPWPPTTYPKTIASANGAAARSVRAILDARRSCRMLRSNSPARSDLEKSLRQLCDGCRESFNTARRVPVRPPRRTVDG